MDQLKIESLDTVSQNQIMSETAIKRHYNRLETEALEMEQSIKRLE